MRPGHIAPAVLRHRRPISRYIVTAVVRCSCASCRLAVWSEEVAEAEVAVGDEGRIPRGSASASAWRYQSSQKPLKAVGRQLGVSHGVHDVLGRGSAGGRACLGRHWQA
jgi:hypothetical protein